MKRNAFGQEIPEFKELFKDKVLKNYAINTLASVLTSIRPFPEPTQPDSVGMADTIVQGAQSRSLPFYERIAHILLEWAGYSTRIIQKALSGRAQTVYLQIAPHVRGTVLDLGCGDGQIGKKLADAGHIVTLADVYKHQNINSTGLEFILFEQGKRVPDSRQYDTSLLLTVMHHSDYPVATLADAQRRTRKGGNIVIIESVYGIAPDVKESSYEDSGDIADKISAEFKSLTSEQQRRANIFFDHFYNRVIHHSEDMADKVNVPFNFRNPAEWQDIFKLLGLKQTHFEYLGIDQPTVPEYHTLHILEKATRHR